MSPIGLSSLQTGMKASSPNCYNFKKPSVLVHTIRSLHNSAYSKNVFLTILTAVSSIKVFLIPWYTHPVMKKYILTQETDQAVWRDFTVRKVDLTKIS